MAGHAAKVVVISLEVASGFTARPLDFSLLKLRLDGTDHTGRHLILKIKQVLDATFEAIRPNVGACCCVNQLRQ